MPPPASKSIAIQYPPRRLSKASDSNLLAGSSTDENAESPTLEGIKTRARTFPAESLNLILPAAGLQKRRSDGDVDPNRMSFSSLYSLGSAFYHGARGFASSGASGQSSVAGSEIDARSEGHSNGPTVATSPVSVSTTSKNGGFGLPAATLIPHNHDGASDPPSHGPGSILLPHSRDHSSTVTRSRSRSRLQRRVSGGTGASSASPGSERNSAYLKDVRESENQKPPVGVIGICALDAKARSKPSRSILNRLIANGEFEVTIFGDKIILDEDVENWPICDFLISFFSDGFPLDKAIAYARLRKPFCVNDLPMQTVLWDRRMCLRVLDKLEVPTPQRIEINRDGGPTLPSSDVAAVLAERAGVLLEGPDDGTGGGAEPPKKIELINNGDTLVVDGQSISKPFVEKPVSGEDHNINIYFSRRQGGGGRRLFRKINNKSSEADDSMNVPRCITDKTSSFIYEKFLKVENAEDVKAYTVGPEYCHAETRKSPVVDGVVKRNPNGKEIRYVTSLSKEEALTARKITEGFGQRVCGFDLLRAGDKSYVIDVNGWSFVKDNNDYYDKAASIMRNIFIREKQRQESKAKDSSKPSPAIEGDDPNVDKPRRNRKSTVISGHRNALKSIFKSPSLTKLAQHHPHLHSHGSASTSPELNSHTIPLSSPPSMERGGGPPTSYPSTPRSQPDFLPPPAIGAVPDLVTSNSAPPEETKNVPLPASRAQWKLKGVVGIVRHADRTPKQKFKFTFHTKPFVDLLKGHQEEVLLIGQSAMTSVLSAVDVAFEEGIEDQGRLKVLRNALVKKGHWVGTKVQIKPMFRQRKKEELQGETADPNPSDDVAPDDGKVAPKELSSTLSSGSENRERPTSRESRSDSNPVITLSRVAAAENNLILDKLQLIIKWGGEPTHSARYQARDLGEQWRNDLMLMNKESLEDASVFTSSERRSTTSAQIFASAFLDTGEKDLPPDFITVRKDLLDDSNAAKDEMDKVKKKLKGLLREGNKAPPQFAWPKEGTAEPFIVARRVVQLMKYLRLVMRSNFELSSSPAQAYLKAATPQIPSSPTESAKPIPIPKPTTKPMDIDAVQSRWCCGEDPELFKERWEKLFEEFLEPEKIDPSKISELYDTMKFDALHNRQFLEWVFTPRADIPFEGETEDDVAVSTPTDEPADLLGSQSSSQVKPVTGETLTVPHKSLGTGSIASRIRLSRRSEATPTVPKPDAEPESHTPQSYFDLYQTPNKGGSKATTDVRLVKLRELYKLCKTLFDYVGPQEYGITNKEKLEIGLLTSLPLLREIVTDLEEVQASDEAKSFWYFTKESHIYTLLNCILEGDIKTKIERNAIPELDYLSQICFELYESQNATGVEEPESFNYSIRITISPGCHTFDPLDVQLDSKHCIGCAPKRSLTAHGDWKEILETLRAKFHTVKLPKSFIAVNVSERFPQAFGTMREGGNGEGGNGEDGSVEGTSVEGEMEAGADVKMERAEQVGEQTGDMAS
ncbi:hypothetical protein K402DRAFT_407790 [Aulographum hederae CBS 113979]|uniref:Inositol hexakisphosphate and diphosphoinositol-pentakisphosphate kinase n=1 Tax=Aulographum hederae CBS 113979 TaxID=1176131 RepID=A0A6G1GMU7_9PEZI|nr:hypothetical protein K402DRAFT_407790 [Aulographum hederae CBS 113979]